MLFGAVDNEAAAVLFFLGLAFTGLGQYVLGVALKVKKPANLTDSHFIRFFSSPYLFSSSIPLSLISHLCS